MSPARVTGKRWEGKLAGWVLSREISRLQSADVVYITEGNIKYVDIARHTELCVVGDPTHARKHLARKSGDPTANLCKW